MRDTAVQSGGKKDFGSRRSWWRVDLIDRSVAQPGRAQPSGGWGRRFESSHSDQIEKNRGKQ